MSLEMLDGFLAGLAVSPRQLSPGEFLPLVWCLPADEPPGEGPARPVFDDERHMAYVLELIVRHWSAISAGLRAGRVHRPLLTGPSDELRGSDWSIGFMVVLNAAADAWQAHLARHPWLTRQLELIIALGESGGPGEGPPLAPAERARRIDSLPAILADFWRAAHGPPQPPGAAARRPRIGRNDPCPCGSGRKYKACCGRPGVF